MSRTSQMNRKQYDHLTLRVLLLLLCFWTVSSPAQQQRSKKSPFVGKKEALERLHVIEDHRQHKALFLKQALYHPSPKVVKKALLALGRIGDPLFMEPLVPFLDHRKVSYRERAAFSISLLGGDLARALLTQHAQFDRKPASRATMWVAAGRVGEARTVPLFAKALENENSATIRTALCRGLALLWNQGSSKWPVPPGLLSRLAWFSTRPSPLGPAAAFALSRYKGPPTKLPVSDLLEAFKKARAPAAKALLARVLGRTQSADTLPVLSLALKQSPYFHVREEAALALGKLPKTEQSIGALKKGLQYYRSSVQVNTLQAIAKLRATTLIADVTKKFQRSRSLWVKATALKTLARLDRDKARPFVEKLLAQPKSPILTAAISALGELGKSEDLQCLSIALTDKNPAVAAKAAEAMMKFPEKAFNRFHKRQIRMALTSGHLALTALLAELSEKKKWKPMARPLVKAYRQLEKPDDVEGKVAVLNALGALKHPRSRATIQSALYAKEKVVVAAAVKAWKALTGEDKSALIPLNNWVNNLSPSIQDVSRSLRASVKLNTNRGAITLKMLPEAPLNAHNFVQLAKKKFYNGLSFHRVVPNFVVQGGDPLGNGYGGPGYLVRDEVSLLSHERGTVGVATAGKDTGGCQFFINLAPNYHLDGRYTLFAKVVGGLNNAERLEVGDKILSAVVYY